jgi:hypothetical protein
MSRRAATRLAWSLWTITVALTALSALLVVLSLSHPNTPVFEWWFGNTFIVIDATVGAIVASRRPENTVGWLLCLSGVAVGASTFISQYAIYALLARPHALPAGEVAAWIASWSLPIIIGLQASYLTLFPTGRLPSRRWRPVAWLIVAVVVAAVISSAFASDAYMGSLGPIRNPLAIEGFSEVYKAVSLTMFPLLYVVAASSLFVRLRYATGVERQQLKWLAYAAAGFALGVILVLLSGVLNTPAWFDRAANAVFLATSEGIIVAIGIAILRYRLYDIDIIINRTLVYGLLTATLALVYFGSVTVAQALFRTLTGQQELPQLVVVASTLLIAALFNPLRCRIQSFIDRRFYRSKYDARKTLEEFSVKLRDETDLKALNEDLVGVVRETMQPAHVSLWLHPETDPKGSRHTSSRPTHLERHHQRP